MLVQPSPKPWVPARAAAGWRSAAHPRSRTDGLLPRTLATLVLCAFTGTSRAELSATISAVSDYRYRGITFSDGGPAVQAGLTYDDPTGWYAGASGSTVHVSPPM